MAIFLHKTSVKDTILMPLDCQAQLCVYLFGDYSGLRDPYSSSTSTVEFQCDRIADHEGDHETWVPTYGYVYFPYGYVYFPNSYK